MKNLRGSQFASFLAALTLMAGSLSAQTTSGNLTGTIYDPAGATIANTNVTVHNTATGIDTSTQSTSNGTYRIQNLPVGSYTLSVDASGFSRASINGVGIALNQTVTRNVTLQLGQTTSTVEVSAAPAAIDTTTAQIQSTYETKQIADLPLTSTGQGVLNLSLLSAGVSTSGTIGVGTGPSVGGQRSRNNNFMLEGVDNNNRSITGPLVKVPNDDVAEFTLLQNQFSPEFGHSTGGQFNTVVKSGTNEFHGLLYDYLQNRNFNAVDQNLANIGVRSNPRLDYNRVGANFGGPILHNKLFFFTGFEYNPRGQSGTPGQLYGPTAAGYATLAGIPGLAQNNLSVLKQYVQAPAASAPSTLPLKEYPVVGGQTIESGLVPVVAPNFRNDYSGVLSVDYNLSQKDQLRGRYIYNRRDEINTAANLPAFYTTIPTRFYLANLSEYHSFTPTVNNEFRLAYNRYNQDISAGSFVFPGLNTFPNITLDQYQVNIGPDGNAPQYTIINMYQLNDNISWTKGAHSAKFGFDGRRWISPQGFTQRVRGDYEWASLDNYLRDLSPDNFGERSAGDLTYWANQWNFAFFGNDDWKIRPNLTINLGLRYEYWTLPAAEKQQALNAASSVPGLISFGVPKTQKTNFMPRIGLAYSPGSSGTTSFRAGFGIGYDVLFDNLGTLSLPPQLQQTNDVDPKNLTPNFLATGGLPNSPVALTPTSARAQTSGYIPDVKLPQAIQWNFGVQHVFAQNYTVEVRYLGTRGVYLPIQNRFNVRAIVTPDFSLPTYLTAPSQAVLDSLPLTLDSIQAAQGPAGIYLPSYYNAGFNSNITGWSQNGNSIYHGLATEVGRRFSNGLQFRGSYTWSHNIDDSTAEVFSTLTTPRRPQDFQDLRNERADSALDHRQRFTFQLTYDVPYFKNRNWFLKNVVGNWEVAPVYTYQTGTWYTAQSATDSNLNGDSYGDRTVINTQGQPGVGSGVTALTNSAGATVAYVANNSNAQYIQAEAGVFPNAARNTLRLAPTDNLDLSVVKRFSISDRYRVELFGQVSNALNHPQFIGGYLADVLSIGYTGTNVRQFTNPATSTFNRPDQVFSSNPRVMTLAAKFTF